MHSNVHFNVSTIDEAIFRSSGSQRFFRLSGRQTFGRRSHAIAPSHSDRCQKIQAFIGESGRFESETVDGFCGRKKSGQPSHRIDGFVRAVSYSGGPHHRIDP